MRLCFVCDEYPPSLHGGIGTFTQLLGRGLVDAGHGVRIIGRDDGAPSTAGTEESDLGVRVTRLRPAAGRLGWVQDRIAVWRKVVTWARMGKIDAVEVPDYLGPAAGWPRLPIPVVARLHSSATLLNAELGRPPRRQVRLLERASLRRADAVVSVSRYTAERSARYFGVDIANCTVSYVPIGPAPAHAGISRQSHRVVFAGKLARMKGVLTLMTAWALVRAAVTDAELHIYGGDRPGASGTSMRSELLAMLPSGTIPSVVFHGHVTRDHLLAELPLAACAVFPSYVEAFAYAPLEAMAAGCATIYTMRASGPELITHGEDGLLVDPDDPRGLADALIAVLTDPAMARRLGDRGRVRSTRFAVPRIAKEQSEFYASVLQAWGARA